MKHLLMNQATDNNGGTGAAQTTTTATTTMRVEAAERAPTPQNVPLPLVVAILV